MKKEFLITADCLVDDVVLRWEVNADTEEEAYFKGMELANKSNVADMGTVDVLPIRGGAWCDPMNACMFKVVSKIDGYEICCETGKDFYEENGGFALRCKG